MNGDTDELTGDEREYSLDELSSLADVTPRTVRYYIVEGLLPPPLTTGRNATYGQEHLDRLHAISAMKEMYLPLREIQHRLNKLTPEQMRDPAYLASLSQAVAMERALGKKHGRQARMQARQHIARHDVRHRDHHPERQPAEPFASSVGEPSSQSWERIPLGDDAELLIRSHKARRLGSHFYRTLHKLRHMIETEDSDGGRSRR